MEISEVVDQKQNANPAVNNSQHRRPIKPEEQSLLDEFKILCDQYGDQFPSICNLVKKETNRIEKGFKSAEEEKTLDVEGGKPIRMTYKVTIPTEKYPNFNYVGRLLGPKGSTLRNLQEISGCKLAVLGRGSMRNNDEEEKCRAAGGKYAHLNEPLHVWMQAFGPPDMVFYKLYIACKEVKKYLHADYNDEIFNEQMAILEQEGGLPKGYTAARAAAQRNVPRGMHHHGMMAGRHGLPLPRGMMSNVGISRDSPHLTARGSMRGLGRGRGVHSRGGRGGRGGRSNSNLPTIASDALMEDSYESALSNSILNGSATSNSAYFEEFPAATASGDMTVPGFQRQAANGSKNIKSQHKSHHQSHSTVGSSTTPVQQRAY